MNDTNVPSQLVMSQPVMPQEEVPAPPAPDDELTEPNADEHVLKVLDGSAGDRKIKWKPTDPASVKKAKAKFDELKAKGYAFFRTARVRVKADEFPTGTGEIVATKKMPKDVAEVETIRTFEVESKETVAVPPRAGG